MITAFFNGLCKLIVTYFQCIGLLIGALVGIGLAILLLILIFLAIERWLGRK